MHMVAYSGVVHETNFVTVFISVLKLKQMECLKALGIRFTIILFCHRLIRTHINYV